MRAAIVETPGHLVIREIACPELQDYQALLRMEACSICNATDHKILTGQLPFIRRDQYPGILGHESVGTVVAVGPRVRHFREGDRVLRGWAVVPGLNSFWGGFAEFGLVTDRAAAMADGIDPLPLPYHTGMRVVPPEIPPDVATQLITLKETLSYLHRCGVAAGKSLLVMGTGPVGLAFCLQARTLLQASPVIVLGRRAAALERARAFGADYVVNTSIEAPAGAVRKILPGGVDVAIDAVGQADLLRLGLGVLAEGGTVGSYGVAAADAEPVGPLQQDPRVHPGACDEGEVHEELLGYLQQGRLDPARFITHRLSLDQLAHGFALLEARQALKVVVMF